MPTGGDESVFIVGMTGSIACFLVLAPQGVENSQQYGETNAENPGEIPHVYLPFRPCTAPCAGEGGLARQQR